MRLMKTRIFKSQKSEEVAGSTESTYKLQNNLTYSLTSHISLYNASFICPIMFVFIYIYIYIYIYIQCPARNFMVEENRIM